MAVRIDSGGTVVGPLPPGVARPQTAGERSLYRACADFEGVFVKQVVGEMLRSARGDAAEDGAQALYQDLADETMTKGLVQDGTFGLAGTLYGFLARTAGASTPASAPSAGTVR